MKKRNRGFTLLEVMVAAAILALGTVLIFESLLSISTVYDYCSSYISSAAFAHEKLWEAEDSVRREGALPADTSGEFSRGGKRFNWALFLESAGVDTVYKVGVQLKWSSGKRSNEVERSGYVSYEKTE
jgi:prepilin-type N-terminal cleavage/methylation domain-containing protein